MGDTEEDMGSQGCDRRIGLDTGSGGAPRTATWSVERADEFPDLSGAGLLEELVDGPAPANLSSLGPREDHRGPRQTLQRAGGVSVQWRSREVRTSSTLRVQ